MFYLTTLLLAICVLFKILVWIFCRNLMIYGKMINENEEGTAQELMPIQEPSTNSNQNVTFPKSDDNGN